MKTETEEKICKYIYCDNIIGENKRKDAKFCCEQHKQDNKKYYQKRNIKKRVVDLTPEEGERLNKIREKRFQ